MLTMKTSASAVPTRPRRRVTATRFLACLAAMFAALLAGGTVAQAQVSDLVDRSTLRVCADPANMPFTNEKGEGFENKIADLLGSKLGLPVDYTWFPQATGFYRMTLGSKRCDIVMGYVAGGDPVLNTNPYYKSAWVLVYRQGGPLDGVDALGDLRLKGQHIGVIAGTPPADALARNGLMPFAKPYALTVDRRFDSPAEQMIADINSGAIDAGILWGPIGGYFARRSEAPLAVVPLVKERGDPAMIYRITFGIRPGELNWKHQLNGFITEAQPEINRILLDYGVPLLDDRNQPVEAGK